MRSTSITINHFIILCILSLISFGFSADFPFKLRSETDKDLTIIKGRLYDRYLKSNTANTDKVATVLGSLQGNGSWKDYNYYERPKLGLHAMGHLQRLVSMCVAYRSADSALYNNPKLRSSIHSALNYWYETDPETDHHWFNEIGAPREMAKILVLMENELSTTELKKGIRILKKAVVDDTFKYGSYKATGQNMIWVARIQLEAGCLENSPQYVRRAVKEIEAEIVVTDKEGIQVDYSFHQHGPLLYSGGYGQSFTVDCAELAALVNQTSYQLGQNQVNVLSKFVLDGQQWMIRGNIMDYGTTGREIARLDKSANSIAGACDNMTTLNTARKQEFIAMAKRIRVLSTADENLSGNRHFWRSDFMVHQRPSFYSSVKMYSNRIIGSESGNGEANFNYHLPDGSNLLIKDGSEYRNIFPLWNWKMIPGVTNRQSSTPLPIFNFGKNFFGSTGFVGGVSDGEYGMSSFDMDKDSVTARKTWFFFDKEYVCLGASINSSSNDIITTTINQCFATGPVTISDKRSQQRQLTADRFSFSGRGWVYHGGAAYIFPENTNVNISREQRTSGWEKVHMFVAKNRVEKGEIFSLWIDHGRKPVESSYSYIVIPEIALQEVNVEASRTNIVILSNNSKVQAIKNVSLGVIQVAFYEAGRIILDDTTAIEADKPCLLMLRSEKLSTKVTVSNPYNKTVSVNVRVIKGESQKKPVIEFQDNFILPDGSYAGQSVTKIYAKSK